MTDDIYKAPLYYDIAFSFVDPKEQVGLFEQYLDKFSKIKVSSCLDLGCGPSLQLLELAKRGYSAIGLDLSQEMLDYLEEKANKENLKIKTICSDMTSFDLPNPVDFIFMLMGTIGYIKDENQMLDHLNSVSKNLKQGGIYLIENFRLNIVSENEKPQTWEEEKDNIKVKTTYQTELVSEDKFIEHLTLEVDDKGKQIIIKNKDMYKVFSLDEFKSLVKKTDLEFIDIFKHDKIEPLEDESGLNYIVIRKN